jgi:hypothetical protein
MAELALPKFEIIRRSPLVCDMEDINDLVPSRSKVSDKGERVRTDDVISGLRHRLGTSFIIDILNNMPFADKPFFRNVSIFLLLSPDPDGDWKIFKEHGLVCDEIAGCADRLKEFATVVKKNPNLLPDRRTRFYDLQELIGHYTFPADADFIKNETIKMANGGIEKNLEGSPSLFNYYFVAALRETLSPALGKLFGPVRSWQEFVNDGTSWATRGSAAGEKVYDENGKKFRISKAILPDVVDASRYYKHLTTPTPQINKTILKHERSKIRTAIQSDVPNYLLQTYVLEPISNLPRLIGVTPLGESIWETAARTMSYIELCSAGKWFMPFDYKGFDRHPLLSELLECIRQLKLMVSSTNHHPDHLLACDQVYASFVDAWILDDQGNRYPVTGSLMSGLRKTALIGTLFCRSWIRAVDMWLSVSTLRSAIDLADFQGDDANMVSDAWVRLARLKECIDRAGIQSTARKYYLDRGRTEFLRVEYTSSGAMGYYSRIVATMSEKKPWSPGTISPVDRVQELWNSYRTVIIRGGSLEWCKWLYMREVRGILKLSIGVGQLLKMLSTPRVLGGLGVFPPVESGEFVALAVVPRVRCLKKYKMKWFSTKRKLRKELDRWGIECQPTESLCESYAGDKKLSITDNAMIAKVRDNVKFVLRNSGIKNSNYVPFMSNKIWRTWMSFLEVVESGVSGKLERLRAFCDVKKSSCPVYNLLSRRRLDWDALSVYASDRSWTGRELQDVVLASLDLADRVMARRWFSIAGRRVTFELMRGKLPSVPNGIIGGPIIVSLISKVNEAILLDTYYSKPRKRSSRIGDVLGTISLTTERFYNDTDFLAQLRAG